MKLSTNQVEWIAIILLTISMALFLVGVVHVTDTEDEPKTIPPNGVVEKFERNGKCYLKVVFEVTPDEYITYDVGDEYGRTEE